MGRILRRHYGGPVVGEHYWPRLSITEPIADSLRRGESATMFGLRRTGKSSVVLEVVRSLRNHGCTVILQDVQGFDRVDHLVDALLAALPNNDRKSNLRSVLATRQSRKALEFLTSLRGQSQPPLRTSPRAVLQHLELVRGDFCELLLSQKGSLVLVIDEFPFLLLNMLDSGVPVAEVNAFLATLRSWRQQGGLPMLLTGSIGLTWLFRAHSIHPEHLSGLARFSSPPPLERGEAIAMLLALARGEEAKWLTKGIAEAIVDESAALYPSFLQFAFGRLQSNKAHTIQAIQRLFVTDIRPNLDEDFYRQFDNRMARYSNQQRAAARDIFRKMAAAVPAASSIKNVDEALSAHREVVRDDLIANLVDDGFAAVDTRGGTIQFDSPLVLTWWQSKPYAK